MEMLRICRRGILAAAVMTVVAAGAPAYAGGVIHDVNQLGLSFDPPDIEVSPGDIVRWTWNSKEHTVTMGGACTPGGPFPFDEPLSALNPVVEWDVPEEASGVLDYYCIPHCVLFGMQGTITIKPLPPLCREDLDGDSTIGFSDLLAVITAWGPCLACPEDLDGDLDVGFSDLLAVITAWGPCR